MLALVPPLLVALFAAWCGSFAGGATFSGSAGGMAALLAAVAVAGPSWRDPLALGRGRLVPLALCAVVAASAWASPVGRAGRVGVALLPALLWLPGIVERCWAAPRQRLRGLRATSAVTAAVALWALLDWAGGLGGGLERAAMPLGHHTLLAAWLVMLLPLALVTTREAAPWRWLGLTGGVLAAAALLATRSTVGLLALGVQALLAWRWRRIFLPADQPAAGLPARRGVPRWAWLGSLALAAAGALLLLRAGRAVAGVDLAWRLRAAYWIAGWRGLVARPLLGWGPGSAAWTVARFMRPVPGANPPSEAIGELHALPVEIAYELGIAGLLAGAVLVVVYSRRRLADLRASADPSRPGGADAVLLAASLLSLAGAATAGLGTGALRVAALPVAAAVAAGAGLAARGQRPAAGASAVSAGRSGAGSALPARVYALLAALVLAAPEAGLWHYDRAVAADIAEAHAAGRPGSGERARDELARAIALDPRFPLYKWRLALLQLVPGTPSSQAGAPGTSSAARGETEWATRTRPLRAAALAWDAARDGAGVAPLWLTAGILARQADLPRAEEALEESCRLAPLDPLPAFYLLAADPRSPAAPVRGALALLDDPRLAAATFWEGREALLASCLEMVRVWNGVDPGWKEALLAAATPPLAPSRAPHLRLALSFDTSPAVSLSLHTFRRRPWPGTWPLVTLSQEPLARLTLPPASALPSTFLAAPPRPVCGLGAWMPASR